MQSYKKERRMAKEITVFYVFSKFLFILFSHFVKIDYLCTQM